MLAILSRGSAAIVEVEMLAQIVAFRLNELPQFAGGGPAMKLETINLRASGEKWVQQQIADDPSLLGLGDLILKDKERIQPRARQAGWIYSYRIPRR
jgi:hypothetical protein